MRWDGYYTKSSQEAYDKLISMGYKDPDNIAYVVNAWSSLLIEDGCISDAFDKENYILEEGIKHFYLVDGEFAEDELVDPVVPEWYEDLKPNTLVTDVGNGLYVAQHYAHGYVYDFNGNIIGKACHLRIATAQEVEGLHHG